VVNNSQKIPLVTIAMPVKNRSWCLTKVLDEIVKDEYTKKRIRFVFVDNMSTDGTYELLQEFKDRYKNEYNDIVLSRDGGNLPELRHICVEMGAGSDFILFLDSDVVVQGTNTIRRMLEHFEDENVGMVAIPYFSSGKIPVYEKIWMLKEKGVQCVQEAKMGLTMIRYSVFPSIGSFDQEYHTEELIAEDGEYSSRVVNHGYKIIQLSEVFALHLHDVRINYFSNLFKRMAPFRWRVIKKTKPVRYVLRLLLYSMLIGSLLLVPFYLPFTLLTFFIMFCTIYAFHLVRMRTLYGKLIGPPFLIMTGIVYALGIYRAMLIDLITTRG